jgi:DNA-binding IscR family transcriptional regulator
MPVELSARVCQFIDQNIESLAELETLLLMRRDPQSSCDAADIAKALYISTEQAGRLLADLARRGMIVSTEAHATRYSLNSSNANSDAAIAEVALAYEERRVAVISLIYSKPLNKVQTFADAFRLRKDPPS